MKKYYTGADWIKYYMILIAIIILNIIIIRFYYFYTTQKELNSEKEVIIWHDKRLEAEIKSQMGLSIEDSLEIKVANEWPGIRGSQFATYCLTLKGKDIEDLEDLKYFINLRNVVLINTNISDLSPLLSLRKLIGLKIDGGRTINLDVIEKAKNLTSLSLSDVPISSTESLRKMDNLQFLTLAGLSIDDISFVSSMKKLYSLTLERLPVTNVSALSYLTNLYELEIIDVKVEEIPPLSESLERLTLKNTNVTDVSKIPDRIRVLELYGNKINNYATLCSLPNLTFLYLTEVNLDNLHSVLSFQNLESLSIHRCMLSNISFLGDCDKLETLDLRDNELVSIEGIEKFNALKTLILSNNKIQSIDGIDRIPYLQWLALSENPVQNIMPLSNIHTLKRIELSGINLQGIRLDTFLKLPDLEVLFLSNCRLTDLDFMKAFHSVHALYVSNNQITDISGIKYMNTSLKLNEVVLDISYNPINDLSAFANCENFSELILSGINLKCVKGLETFQNFLYIGSLVMEDCNLDSLSPLKNLSEIKRGIGYLSLSNNQIKDLSLFISDKWKVYELDVSDNLIIGNYMEEIGAFEVSPGQYQYGRSTSIMISNTREE